MGKIKVWDGFIRGFHWLLVGALAVLYISGEEGWLELHFVTGYLLLALMLTRLIWGVIGSDTARLSRLINPPAKVMSAIKGEDSSVGHNAAGSLMVLLFFVLILMQLITGLFTTDDILVDGPLVKFVSYDLVELAGTIHHSNIDFLIAAIALHITAIIIYRIKGKNLAKTLITGSAELSSEQPKMQPGWKAYIIFLVLAGVLIGLWGLEPLSQLVG